MQSGPCDGASLLRLTSALQGAVPYYTSIQAQGQVDRFALHRLPEAQFGRYNSKQRLYTVTNAVKCVLLGLGYMVEGVAAFPSMQQLHSSSGRLYLFIEREADAALLSRDLSNPTRSVRGAQIAASLADFQDGLRGRLLCDGTVVGPQQEVSAEQVVADVRFADYIQPTGGAAGYKYAWPGDVVLKIRNLPQPLHKPGVAAAVLQAAGYDAQMLVGDHHRDAATALGDRIEGIPDRTAQREQAARQEAVDCFIARMQTLQGDYDQQLTALQSDLEQQAAALGLERDAARQQLEALDDRISGLREQLGQLRAAEDQAAIDAAVADDSSEEVEMVPVLSKAQRQRRRAHRREAAAAVEQQILQQQQQQQRQQQQQQQEQ
ncbi:hypothetical protein OEZ86_001037 [Tetradesmus obliquus]|nr:hypothetical protein OEZ86_001037 [Tetradesmus obliquus]